MAGLGLFMVIFGAVSAWSGWTGRNVVSVFSSTLTGKAQPSAGKNPFRELTEGFPGLIGGALAGTFNNIPGAGKGFIPPGSLNVPGLPTLPNQRMP